MRLIDTKKFQIFPKPTCFGNLLALLTSPITTYGQSIHCGMKSGDEVLLTGGAMPLPKAT